MHVNQGENLIERETESGNEKVARRETDEGARQAMGENESGEKRPRKE
jgi:hypothetical protein